MDFNTRLLIPGIVGLVAVLCNVSKLLAQEGVPHVPGVSDVNGVGSMITDLTNTGFLLWFAWHTCTRAMPGLAKDFRAEMAEQRQSDEVTREKDRDLARSQTMALVEELKAERTGRQQREETVLNLLAEITRNQQAKP